MEILAIDKNEWYSYIMKNVHNHSIITSKSDADEIIEEMENSRDRCIPLSEKFKEEIKIWRRGDFPENFLLKHEIIDLEHPNTKAFTELCAELIAPLYTDKNVPAFIGEDLVQYDFSKNPVRFLLSKNPLVNAFAIPIANPPVIIINEGMFTQGWISTREELQAVLIHEMTHILLAKRHGLGRKVWKREESIAYSLPFYLLSRTESNITNIYEEGSMYHRMSTTHISNEEHWSVMCSDEHVTPDTMKKIVTSSLAATVSLRDAQKKKTREVDDIWLGQVKVFYEENEQNRIRDMLKNGSGTVCEKLERVIIDIAESLREADVANILDIFEKTLQEEPDSKKNIYALFQKYAWKLYNLGVRPINPGTGRRLDK